MADPVTLGVGAEAAAPAIKGAADVGAADVLAPAAAAAAAPGAVALPEIAVTAPALAAGAGTEAALGGGVAAGLGGADIAAGLGAGSLLGITPALAGGLSPSSVVGGEFNALNAAGGNFGTNPMTAVPQGVVPGFQPGGPPLPAAAPRLPGVAGVGGSGAGGSQASGHDLSGSAVDAADAAATDPALAGYEGSVATPANPNIGGRFGSPTPLPGAGGGGGFFSNNAGLLTLAGAGLGAEVLAPKLANSLGLTKVPQQGPLTNVANQAGGITGSELATGQTLQQPLVTGVLPQAQQAQIDQGLSDAIGAIKGRYASLGLSGSTMEQSAISSAKQNAQVIKADIEAKMFQEGTAAVQQALAGLNLQDSVYMQLLNAQVAQDDQLQASIGQFASALALGSAISSLKRA